MLVGPGPCSLSAGTVAAEVILGPGVTGGGGAGVCDGVAEEAVVVNGSNVGVIIGASCNGIGGSNQKFGSVSSHREQVDHAGTILLMSVGSARTGLISFHMVLQCGSGGTLMAEQPFSPHDSGCEGSSHLAWHL